MIILRKFRFDKRSSQILNHLYPEVNQAKPITIKDIARVAGVSTATVSQALRPRAASNIKLQEDTIERVRSVANQLNYRPHVGARSIRSKHFGTVGYFTAKEGLYTHTPDGYMAGVHDVAEEKDCRITMIRIPHRLDDIKYDFPKVFTENNLDALIIESYNHLADKIFDQIKENSLPVIYLNNRLEKNSVYVDDVLGAAELTNYLLGQGYQKICLLIRQIAGGPSIDQMHHSAIDRSKGYLRQMNEAGFEPKIVTCVTESVAGLDVDLKDSDWEQIKDYEAVIAYDDDLANALGRYCLRNAIRIPSDIAIAGFNGDYASMCSWMRLTTMQIPSYDMGRSASQMAFQLLENRQNTAIPSTTFQSQLIMGETT